MVKKLVRLDIEQLPEDLYLKLTEEFVDQWGVAYYGHWKIEAIRETVKRR